MLSEKNNEIENNQEDEEINENKEIEKEEEIINNNKNENDNEEVRINNKEEQSPYIPKYTADNVVSIILEKIITNIIVEKKIKDSYSKIPSHCFSYLKKLISTYLKNNFIFYENGIDDLSFQQNLMHFEKEPINKINKWDFIKEPSPPKYDRHITGKNKVIKLKRKDENNNNIDSEIKDKENNNISDINSVQINSKNEIEENNIKEKKEKIVIKKIIHKKRYKMKKKFGEIVKEKELKRELMLQKEKNKKNTDMINNKNKKNKNEEADEENDDEDNFVLEMTSHDLKNIDMTYKLYNDNEENDLLRKERELLLIEKEKERIKEEKKKKKEKQKKLKLLINKNNINSNILTFDPNGKIIKKNLLANINIIKRDLPKPQLSIKDSNNKSTEIVKQRHSLFQIKEKSKQSLNNKKTKNELVICNPNDKVKLFDFDYLKQKNREQEIKLGGNNFELVQPETGVIISNENNNQKKEGGFNYLKKYNKPSMNEYNKLSYNSQNSINFLSSYMPIYDDNFNSNENQNYIGYKEEFSENNNPLLQDGYKMPSLNSTRNNNEFKNEGNENKNINKDNLDLLKNKKKFLKIGKNKTPKILIHSYDYHNNRMNSNRYKSFNSIRLNDNMADSNLKNIFNENEENKINKKYNSIENDSYSYLRNKEYILSINRKYKKRRELPLITENNGNKNILDELVDINKINKFNYRIVKNKKWGNDNHPDPIYHERNNLIKFGNYLQTDAKINSFRKDKLNNIIKDSGINIINNIRERKKK